MNECIGSGGGAKGAPVGSDAVGHRASGEGAEWPQARMCPRYGFVNLAFVATASAAPSLLRAVTVDAIAITLFDMASLSTASIVM